eukprot:COSAG06_NODE_2758_length_6333_cov_15.507379_3_plen_41_part_00
MGQKAVFQKAVGQKAVFQKVVFQKVVRLDLRYVSTQLLTD